LSHSESKISNGRNDGQVHLRLRDPPNALLNLREHALKFLTPLVRDGFQRLGTVGKLCFDLLAELMVLQIKGVLVRRCDAQRWIVDKALLNLAPPPDQSCRQRRSESRHLPFGASLTDWSSSARNWIGGP
jgi:hypothetical protein